MRLQDHFLPGASRTERSPKGTKEGLLNLKSNELRQSPHDPQLSRYPDYLALYESIGAAYGIPAENFVVTPGSDEGIKLIMYTLLSQTKCLFLQSPNYVSYERYGSLIGADVFRIEPDEDYAYDLQRFLQLPDRPGIVVLTNPHGFSGHLFTSDQVTAVCASGCMRNQLVVVDEAYAELASPTLLPLLRLNKNLILIKSFSKSHGLAGVRVGWIAAHPELIDYLGKWFPETGLCATSMRIVAHELRNPSKTLEARRSLERDKCEMVEALKTFSKWRIFNTCTNFILIEMPTSEDVRQVHSALLKKGIYAASLETVPSFEKCLRLTVGTPEEQFRLFGVLSAFR